MTMDPRAERKFLANILKRANSPTASVFSARWFLPLAWLGLVVLAFLLLSIGPLIGQSASALSFILFGFLGSYIWFRVSAAKGWPVLSSHINKQSIIGRLEALEP